MALLLFCAACGGSSGGTKAATMPSVKPTVSASASPVSTPTPSPTPAPTHHKPMTLHVRPILYIGPSTDGLGPNFTTFHGAHCKGAGSLSDLKHGAAVTIYNASGHRVVGLGYVKEDFVSGKKCELVASVKDLPPEAFYEVQWTDRTKLAASQTGLVSQTQWESIS